MGATIMEKRAAAVKAADELVKGAGDTLTDEQSEKLGVLVEQVKGFDAQIEKSRRDQALVEQVKGLGAGDTEVPGRGRAEVHAKTLGGNFIRHVGDVLEKSRGERFTATAPEWAVKAAADPHLTGGHEGAYADWLTEIDTNIVTEKREKLVVADLLGSGTTSAQAIKYYREGAFEGDFAGVAEGTRKPQVHVTEPTPEIDYVKKMAAWAAYSDEVQEDLPFLVSEINSTLLYRLGVYEEKQLLNGNGTGNNLLGLLNRTGVQLETADDEADNADSIFRAATKIENATDFSADGLVIHPLDYQAFRLNKDGNGQYFGGGYFGGQYGQGGIMQTPPLWGLRTVVTTAVEQGKPLVGAFSQAATVYRKGGIKTEVSNSDGTDFIDNMLKVRVEQRIALAVRQPLALVKVTLA